MRLVKMNSRVEKRKIFKEAKKQKARSALRRLAFSDRRAIRRSKLGRQTEERVEKLLKKKLKTGELLFFEKHLPNSAEDRDGKDFSVSQKIDEETFSASFGVTISLRYQNEHRALHPDVPLIIIPPEMNDERIWQRICMIIDKKVVDEKARA
ncbi:MAG: hypothetical protein HYV47_02330 [Candidatus Nealsonbacteria bacterium]|nr:hypothetical protein [Candidatus Nealsonbacteria bacterium]